MALDAGMVFGASERLQPVTEAPASVTFITAQEIARFGYRSLADILRSVRGMYVTDDRNFSYVGMRGFGKPGDYNSRILLLINGHRVNDNVFGQAEIGAEFGLDPAMFERVEIIRGPASSLYGDSAFFAVVNVITRTGASLNGGSITVEAGTLGAQLVRASAGHVLANGVDIPGRTSRFSSLNTGRSGDRSQTTRFQIAPRRECGLWPHRVRRVLHFQGRVENLKHAIGPRQAALDAVGDVRDLSHLVGKLLKQVGKNEQPGPQTQLAARHEVPTIAQQHDHIELREQAHGRLK